MLKLDLLNMAFGLVHSSVERSTSWHGHLQASARLLYGLAWICLLIAPVPVHCFSITFIVWKWVNLEHSMNSNWNWKFTW